MKNHTTNTGFILVAYFLQPYVQITLFVVFLLAYIITIIGNAIVIAIIMLTTKLHTPMYYFLWFLSCLDICNSTAIVPRMLKDLLAQEKHISFNECLTQIFMIILLLFFEVFILMTMGYDRYAAICHPLTYANIISTRFCIYMVSSCFLASTLVSIINIYLLSQLPLCGRNKIDNFFCELPALLRLSCADILLNDIVLLLLAGGVAGVTVGVILMSYIYIIKVILRIPSKDGRRKVFSTCSTHLIVVFLFFGAGAGTYLIPTSSQRKADKLTSLLYTVLTPMLNPVIYSLRNEDMKLAIRKSFRLLLKMT